MARPFYSHEAADYDLGWLISNFLYERPDFIPVQVSGLPMLLLPYREPAAQERSPDVLQKSVTQDSET